MANNTIDRTAKKPNRMRKFVAISFCFLLPFGIGAFVFIIISKSVHAIQKMLYQKPGEILIGAGIVTIPTLLLTICLTYLLALFLFNLMDKYLPYFMKYIDVEGAIKLDKKAVNKFAKKLVVFTIATIPLWILLIHVCINEYISIGSNYMVASSASIFQNRKDYRYSDVKFLEAVDQNNSVHPSTYIYEFSDGRTISDVDNDVNIRRVIQAKQRELNLRVSTIGQWVPKRKAGIFLRTLSMLIFGSTYFVIAWLFSRLTKRKK